MTIPLNEDCRPFLKELADFIKCDVSILNQFYRDFPNPARWGGGTVEPAVGQLLYILTRFFAPVKALEIGTNFGYSTYCIAKALQDNSLGLLMTFEIEEEFATAAELRLEKLWDYIDFRIGDSRQILYTSLKRNYFNPDLVFIDSDHTYETTKIEMEICLKTMNKGGVILLHDIFSDGVGRYLNGFNYPDFRTHYIPTQPNTGFGILMHESTSNTEPVFSLR